jgi:hypothetical protein
MPSALRSDVKSYIDELIQNIGKNEQYKIVTFGEQLTILQDFTADRYDLSNAANKIVFNGQQSKIYDAIYNTIPKVQPLDGNPCYYRTIVITDGVDDTVTGVTKEELYLKLQADTYPIDVIAVSRTKQSEPEKELSALTRMSGGKYANLHAGSDLPALSASIAVGDVFWLRAIIPGTLLDGSTRQVDISDGVTSLQFDVKVPVFDVPAAETPMPTAEPTVEEPTAMPTTATSTAPAETSEPITTAAPEVKGGLFGDYSIVVYIGTGIGLIILIAVIIAVITVRGKKKKRSSEGSASDGKSTFSDKTEILGGGSSDNSVEDVGGALCVRLRNVNNPDQIWNLALTNPIVVGRDTSSQVCLNDTSVSRPHCKLYLTNGVATVENLSKSNITQLNGEALNVPHPIKEGDKLKCGRVTIMVDSLYGSDSSNVGNLNKMTGFVNV